MVAGCISHFQQHPFTMIVCVCVRVLQDVDEYFENEKGFLLEYHAKIKDATQKADKMTKVHKSETPTVVQNIW